MFAEWMEQDWSGVCEHRAGKLHVILGDRRPSPSTAFSSACGAPCLLCRLEATAVQQMSLFLSPFFIYTRGGKSPGLPFPGAGVASGALPRCRRGFGCEGHICHHTAGNGLRVFACYHTRRSGFVRVSAYFTRLFLPWETPDLAVPLSSPDNVLELSKAVCLLLTLK